MKTLALDGFLNEATLYGHYNLRITPAQLREFFDFFPAEEFDWQRRYNIAPTQSALAIREEDGLHRVRPFRWGPIPAWAHDVRLGAKMINICSDTLAEKEARRSPGSRSSFSTM